MHPFKTAATLIAMFIAVQASGQSVYDTVKADRDRASAHEGPYDMTAHPQTKPPKGYVPFHISHYGRHGARYAWRENTYTIIRDALMEGREKGTLTPRGERLYGDYIPFCSIPTTDFGCLVPLGQKQQAFIAGTMSSQFPEVFRDGGKVVARASRVQRAITSMASFCTRLAALRPGLDISMRSYTSEMRVTRSEAGPGEPDIIGEAGRTSASFCSSEEYASRKVNPDPIVGSIFTRSPFANRQEAVSFCLALYDIWSGYRNYSEDLFLEDIFTPEQLCALWDAANFRDLKSTIEKNRCNPAHFVEDLISRADEAIEGNGVCADLRFGHDIVVTSELIYLNINGLGRLPECEEQVRDCIQTWNVPMASNLQFVFYRSRRSPDILFKLLLNGSEASLSDLEPLQWPYYRWDDFKKRYSK